MFENIAYVGLGFAVVFLGLELAWHIFRVRTSMALYGMQDS